MKVKTKRRERKIKANDKITPWIYYLLGSLDIAMRLLGLLLWCISPEPPEVLCCWPV